MSSTSPASKKQKTEQSAEDQSDEQSDDIPVPVLLFDGFHDMDDTAKPLDLHAPDLLDQIMDPLSREEFLQDYFGKKAISLDRGYSKWTNSLIQQLHDLDPEYLFQETSSENIFVWLKNKPPTMPGSHSEPKPEPDHKIHSLEIADPAQALLLHQVGQYATYCRAPPDVEQPLVANMLRGTGLGCGQYDPSGNSNNTLGRGEVELFMSASKDHVTPWHYDFQHNFTIQLSGEKRWKLKHGTVRQPLRACTPHYAAPEAVESQLKVVPREFKFGDTPNETNSYGPIENVIMEAGDVLYFPPGMWHQVATEEPGVSLNISLMGSNYAQVACQALQHMLLTSGNDAWRETVVSNGGVDQLQCLMETLPSLLQDFCQVQGARAILPPVLQHPPSFASVAKDDEVDKEDNDDEGKEKDVRKSNNDDGDNEDSEMEQDDYLEQEEKEDVEKEAEEVLGCTVIDVSKFELPENAPSLSPPFENEARLVLNSLAWVRPVTDVTDYYDTLSVSEGEHLHLVNINFAGNEMHESAVRLVVRDERDPTDIDKEESGAQTLSARTACYLYHGLYVWTTGGEKQS